MPEARLKQILEALFEEAPPEERREMERRSELDKVRYEREYAEYLASDEGGKKPFMLQTLIDVRAQLASPFADLRVANARPLSQMVQFCNDRWKTSASGWPSPSESSTPSKSTMQIPSGQELTISPVLGSTAWPSATARSSCGSRFSSTLARSVLPGGMPK